MNKKFEISGSLNPEEVFVSIDLSKVRGGKGDNSMEQLLIEIEKLQSLMNDPQPGMFMWNGFVFERLTNINKLSAELLGK